MHLAEVPHPDVLGLEVAMQDAPRVGVGHGLALDIGHILSAWQVGTVARRFPAAASLAPRCGSA